MVLLRSQGNGNIFVAAVQPPGWINGDFWYDNVNNLLYENIGGSATLVGTAISRIVSLG